ncbi:MAG: hypothetical protein AAF415_20445 [Pseudomonadota bacterium]
MTPDEASEIGFKIGQILAFTSALIGPLIAAITARLFIHRVPGVLIGTLAGMMLPLVPMLLLMFAV